MKNLFSLLVLLTAIGPFVYSQTVIGGKSVGIVNGATAEMPHAVNPEDAKHQCITGEVRVLVEFKSSGGHPTSTKVVSGDLLLRAAAETAAKKAVFKPINDLPGESKLTGVLVYKFTAPPHIKCIFRDRVVNDLVKSFPKSKIKSHLYIKKETQVKVLIVIMAVSGEVVYASALPGSGSALLEKQAEMLARQTTFSPFYHGGPIRVRCYLLIKFKPNGDVGL